MFEVKSVGSRWMGDGTMIGFESLDCPLVEDFDANLSHKLEQSVDDMHPS